MLVFYYYDQKTRLFTGSSSAPDGTPTPDSAVLFSPPPIEGPGATILNEDLTAWGTIEDYRGWPVVDQNGNPATVTEPGPLPEGWKYVPPVEPGQDVDTLRKNKLAEVMTGYSAAFAPIETIYPTEERETWPIQLEEARAVLADPTTETPMLSILVALRGLGETVADFAQVVMANNAMYRQFAAFITGQQQRMFREVNALETTVEIRAYVVQYAMPEGIQEYLGG